MSSAALPLGDGEMSPAAGAPTTGVEYLMQVRYEARRTRLRRAVAPPATPHSAQVRASDAVASWRSDVSDEWQLGLLSKFAVLRSRVLQFSDLDRRGTPTAVPHVNDEVAWRGWIMEHRQQPSLSVVASLGDVRVRGLFELAAEWFREPGVSLCERRARWLFALLAAADLPLDADTAAALMSLYRSLKRLRARAAASEVAAFDVLLTVIGYGFNQRDDDHL